VGMLCRGVPRQGCCAMGYRGRDAVLWGTTAGMRGCCAMGYGGRDALPWGPTAGMLCHGVPQQGCCAVGYHGRDAGMLCHGVPWQGCCAMGYRCRDALPWGTVAGMRGCCAMGYHGRDALPWGPTAGMLCHGVPQQGCGDAVPWGPTAGMLCHGVPRQGCCTMGYRCRDAVLWGTMAGMRGCCAMGYHGRDALPWGTVAGMRGCCAVGYCGTVLLGTAAGTRARSAALTPERGSGHAVPRWLLALLSHLLFFLLLFSAALTRLPNRSRIGTAPPCPAVPLTLLPAGIPWWVAPWVLGWLCPPSPPPHGCAGQGVSSQGWVGVRLPAALTLVPVSPAQRDHGTRLPPLAQGQGER